MIVRAAFVFIFGIIVGLTPDISFAERAEVDPSSPDGIALSAYRGLVEEHIGGVLRGVRIVATSSEAKTARWESLEPLLMRLSDDIPTDATAWFVLPDGSYYATEVGGMTELNLKDRPYFPALMAGKEVVGELVISKSTGHRSVIIATPVVDRGKVVGGVGVSLRVRLLSELVDAHLPLPAKGYFYALDPDTRIVLHRKAERMFKTPGDVGDEALGADFQQVLKNSSGTFDYVLNGEKISSRFERSSALGWYFFIAQPME